MPRAHRPNVSRRTTLVGVVILAVACVSVSASAQTATDAPAPPPTWSTRVSAATYVLPDDENYVQPTVAADRGALHLEGRYNYEDHRSISGFVGWNLEVGHTVKLEVTPIPRQLRRRVGHADVLSVTYNSRAGNLLS